MNTWKHWRATLHWAIEHPMEEFKDSYGWVYRFNDQQDVPGFQVLHSKDSWAPLGFMLDRDRNYIEVLK